MFTKKSVLGEFSAMILAVAFGSAALLLGAATQARADILLTVSAGTTTESFDFASNTSASATTTTDGYSLNVESIVTNFPGAPTNGVISTTVNVLGAVASSDPLFVTVQLIASGAVVPGGPYITPPFSYSTQPLLPWTAPTATPVTVSAGTSITPSGSLTSGTVLTTTYFDSPPAATFGVSSPAVSASSTFPAAGIENSVSKPNAGTFTLSQTIELSGINIGATGFSVGGTSSVAVPEPGRIVGLFGMAGMMGLGLFWQRRRSAALNV